MKTKSFLFLVRFLYIFMPCVSVYNACKILVSRPKSALCRQNPTGLMQACRCGDGEQKRGVGVVM